MNATNVDDLNQWRLSELVERMKLHYYNHNLTVIMKQWDCVRKSRYEVHTEDGVLIYVEPIITLDFYPGGYFECGACKKLTPLSYHHHAYFNYNRDCMICTSCNNRYKHTMVPAYPLMCARIIGEPELDDTDHVNMITIDRTPTRDAVQYRIAYKRAERIAKLNPTVHFFGGKSARDLYLDLLARRVVRRFRRFVATRLRLKVAWVITSVTGLNAHTSHGIASTMIM